jgi:hypothetical protein
VGVVVGHESKTVQCLKQWYRNKSGTGTKTEMTKKLGKNEFRACGGGWESFRMKFVLNLEMCVEYVADWFARFTYTYEREPY